MHPLYGEKRSNHGIRKGKDAAPESNPSARQVEFAVAHVRTGFSSGADCMCGSALNVGGKGSLLGAVALFGRALHVPGNQH